MNSLSYAITSFFCMVRLLQCHLLHNLIDHCHQPTNTLWTPIDRWLHHATPSLSSQLNVVMWSTKEDTCDLRILRSNV
jgi:hypothetical protein